MSKHREHSSMTQPVGLFFLFELCVLVSWASMSEIQVLSHQGNLLKKIQHSGLWVGHNVQPIHIVEPPCHIFSLASKIRPFGLHRKC